MPLSTRPEGESAVPAPRIARDGEDQGEPGRIEPALRASQAWLRITATDILPYALQNLWKSRLVR